MKLLRSSASTIVLAAMASATLHSVSHEVKGTWNKPIVPAGWKSHQQKLAEMLLRKNRELLAKNLEKKVQRYL